MELSADMMSIVATTSIVISGLTITLGSMLPAYAEGKAVVEGLRSIAQQPDEANTITRTLFVGLAMIESTAIYCLVISLILIFANPFWNFVLEKAGG